MTAANDWQLSRDRPGPGILSEAEQRRETIFPPQPTQVPEPGTNFSHHSPHRPHCPRFSSWISISDHFSVSNSYCSVDEFKSVMHFYLSLRLNIRKNAWFLKARMRFFSLVWNKVDITQTLKMTELYFSPDRACHATARRCWLRLLGERSSDLGISWFPWSSSLQLS